MCRDHDSLDLAPLYAALERLEGVDVLARYESLIADHDVPGAAFVHYQRERALGAFTEACARAAVAASGSALSDLVTAVNTTTPR